MTTDASSAGAAIVLQAEDMTRDGFEIVNGNNADGGELVKATAANSSLSTDFTGPAGNYDLTLHVQDESDGQSELEIFVDGISVGTITLDGDNNGGGSNNGGFSSITLSGIDIPAGANIEIRSARDGGEWVRIDKVVLEQNIDDGSVTIQAEDMTLTGYDVVSGNQADGGELVRANSDLATLSTTFDGAAGTYALSIYAQDETDGQSEIEVFVDGVSVGVINLDLDVNGGGSNNGGFTEFTLDGIALDPGSVVEIRSARDGGEWARIDKIRIQPSDADVLPPAPDNTGDPIPDVEGSTEVAFQDLSAGTIVNAQFEGVTISAYRNQDGPDGPNAAMIFDGASPTGGDTDLTSVEQGNMLIITEDFDSSDPDDNAGGGTFTFEFDVPSRVNGVTIIDIEERGEVSFFDADGVLIDTLFMPSTQDGEVTTVPFDMPGVSVMTISINGSGAIDDISFTPETDNPPNQDGATIGDFVFLDENVNGIQDDGEIGVEGVTVVLYDEFGTEITSVITGAEGQYAFDGLEAGSYQVQFQIPDGYIPAPPNQGASDDLDSDADAATGFTEIFVLGEDEVDLSIDAGLVLEDTGGPGPIG